MSFSDLMSSGRGPGVIGMVMALIVLLGFGFLFMFAFDDGMQGGDRSIESVIREQARDIASYRGGVENGKKTLELAPSRLAAARELSLLKRMNQGQVDQAAQLAAKIEAEGNALVAARGEFEAYKDRYRAHVRSAAKGSEISELKTMGGVVYKNVNIREVTAVGIQIRHDDGQKRIPFEDLPEAMRDHFQFDPDQKARALVTENQQRDEHEAAAAVANEQADEQMAQQREKDAALAKQRLMREIAGKQAQIASLMEEISQLDDQMQQAEAQAAAARASGRMHINRTNNFASNIRSKQNRINNLNAEIRQMQSRL